jgi:hypothetical protein
MGEGESVTTERLDGFHVSSWIWTDEYKQSIRTLSTS